MTGEVLRGASANAQAGARLDIAANGVRGGTFERTYFDVRVFNPHALPTDTQIPKPSIVNTNRLRRELMNKG